MHRESILRNLKRVLNLRVVWLVGAWGSLTLLALGMYLGWGELSQYRWQINLFPLALSFVAYSGALVMGGLGWHWIITTLGGRSGFRRDLKLYFYANLNKRLPTPLWFLAGRLHLYEEEGLSKAVTSAATFLEMAMIALSGVVVFLTTSSMLALPGSWNSAQIVAIAALGPLAIIVARPDILIRLLSPLATRAHVDLGNVEVRARDTLLWTAWYCLDWFLGGFILLFLIRSVFPLNISSLPRMIAIWTLSGLVGLLNFTVPLGIGVRELTLAYLLTSVLPLSVAVVISVGSRFWLTLGEAIWLGVVSRF